MSTPKQVIPILLALVLAACSSGTQPPLSPDTAIPATAAATFTPAPPTATPLPMAALVNDEGITLDEFNAELERFKAAQTALGNTVTEQDAAATVLDDLISQTLLAQGAHEAGFSADDAAIQARIDKLIAQLGGADQLSAWQKAHNYSEESFRMALKRVVETAWMRDKIISEVPKIAKQVHARQILLYNQEAANNILAQLQSGADFDELAAQIDPVTRGDLGWFPQGYLLEQAVEQAAFSLQPGQISEVIASGVGFHIIKILEIQPDRNLAPDALLAMQNHALTDWVTNRRQQSNIILAP